MSGVEGLGRSVSPGAGAPLWVSELAGSLDQVDLQVTSDNVLRVAKVLSDQADQILLDGGLYSSQVVVDKCGDDWVSADAAQEFSARLRALHGQGILVARMLKSAAERLEASASSYVRVEAECRAEVRGAQL